jgi:hypothetical protein
MHPILVASCTVALRLIFKEQEHPASRSISFKERLLKEMTSEGHDLILGSRRTVRGRDQLTHLIGVSFTPNRWWVDCTIGIFVKRLKVPAFFLYIPVC